MKRNISSLLLAGSFFGMAGISIPNVATADYGGYFKDSNPQIVNEICQFVNDTGSTGIKLCGSDGGEVALVPKKSKKCFYLTDISANNNNGSTVHSVRVTDGNHPGANPNTIYLVLTVPGSSTVSEHFVTPIVFSSNDGLHVYDFPNQASDTVYVTATGYYDWCPRYDVSP